MRNVKLRRGLISYWRMEGPLWDGTANEVIDSSGNGHHGTSVGATNIAGGKLERGGDFDYAASN